MNFSELKLSQAAQKALSHTDYWFVSDGYTYFSSKFFVYRYHGELEDVANRAYPNTLTTRFVSMKDFIQGLFDVKSSYNYTLSPVQPNTENLKGKKRFHFGKGCQLVNAPYLREIRSVLGSKATFYLGESIVSPVFAAQDVADPEGTWSAVILPTRYDPNEPVDEYSSGKIKHK